MEESEKWPKAPLIFVLVAIRISQYPKLETRIPDLHEAVLALLPERENTQGFSFSYDFSAPAQPPRVDLKPVTRLFSREGGISMFVRDDLIAFEMTQYDGYRRAQQLIRQLLGTILQVLPNLHPQLVAMRYIDAILEGDSEFIDDFVQPGLLGVALPYRLASSQTSQQFQVTKDQTLTISFVRGVKPSGTIVLPEGIELPSMLQQNGKLAEFAKHQGEFGLLDFDAGARYGGLADLDRLMVTLQSLHSSLRDGLPSVATPDAVNYWKGLR